MPNATADLPVVTEMPDIEPVYPMPVGLKFAQLHRRTDIYQHIFKKYVPRVKLASIPMDRRMALKWDRYPERVVHDGKEKDVWAPDPEVFWVGSFTYGMVWTGVTLALAQGDHASSGPTMWGRFIRAIAAPGKEAIETKAISAVFERAGESQPIVLGQILLDAEPGQILNSPDAPKEKEIPSDQRDLFAPEMEPEKWDPRIATEVRFGLHYLRRGDKLTLEFEGWPRPRTKHVTLHFVLRPPQEGASLMPQTTQQKANAFDLRTVRG